MLLSMTDMYMLDPIVICDKSCKSKSFFLVCDSEVLISFQLYMDIKMLRKLIQLQFLFPMHVTPWRMWITESQHLCKPYLWAKQHNRKSSSSRCGSGWHSKHKYKTTLFDPCQKCSRKATNMIKLTSSARFCRDTRAVFEIILINNTGSNHSMLA